ncbi:uncharacterized protein LOC135818336 isoform X2 [Sycon ciliatum]|uniref:uncharacterized protein LOC135818336 isoform X2 n=1 Tax=Sycon ciliatum TaxID=27933 RepID=UPI0031F6FF16
MGLVYPKPWRKQPAHDGSPRVSVNGGMVKPGRGVMELSGLRLLQRYHRTMFRLSSRENVPLAAALFLPLENLTTGQSADSEAGAGHMQHRINMWVTVKWHMTNEDGSVVNEQPTRYAWQCSIDMPTVQHITEEHWLALDMQAFFRMTFKQEAEFSHPPFFLTEQLRSSDFHTDKLHITLQSGQVHLNTSANDITILDVEAESNDPTRRCAEVLTLPCSLGQRGQLQWEPFLAFANDETPEKPPVHYTLDPQQPALIEVTETLSSTQPTALPPFERLQLHV